MKYVLINLLVALIVSSLPVKTIAQKPVEITIILLRHAEKDSIGTDPWLSAAVKLRTEKLIKYLRM